VSDKGSPYVRFKRALATGNLALVRTAAAELPAIDLGDALAICLLMSDRDDERFERAAVRWLARVALERPAVGLGDLRDGLVAFEAMPYNPEAARTALAGLCERLGLREALRRLRTPPAAGGRS
jgi:hypothetical protein